MEEKRFQIFISSTYEDLKDERIAVFDAVMKMGNIPGGMESFPAFDEDQIEYIKGVIDDSDYYILIIAGRYGSLSDDEISFTEKEYDYAVSKKIPILSFLFGPSDAIPVGKTDKDPNKATRLTAFKEKVSNAGRNVRYWKDAQELSLQITQALIYAIKAKPAIGWIRGNIAASVEILSEINELRKTNAMLSHELTEYKSNEHRKLENLAPLDQQTTITIAFWDSFGNGPKKNYIFSWGDLFSIIGPSLLAPQREGVISSSIISHLIEHDKCERSVRSHVLNKDLDTIKLQFVAYGFIEIFVINGHESNGERLQLTETGKAQLLHLKAVRSNGIKTSST
jgi:hypothetical protein